MFRFSNVIVLNDSGHNDDDDKKDTETKLPY